jgi:hypothetical protein
MAFPSDKELGNPKFEEVVREDADEHAKDAQSPSTRRNLLLLSLLGILWVMFVACQTLIEMNLRFPEILTMTTWQRYVLSKGCVRWLYNVSLFRFFYRVAFLCLLFAIEKSPEPESYGWTC